MQILVGGRKRIRLAMLLRLFELLRAAAPIAAAQRALVNSTQHNNQ